MDDLRTPGAWLDDEMTEREANEAIKATSVMAELANEQDPGKIINSLAPYMNSFMHLMYLLIRGKLGLEATDDGVKYKDKENLYFDIVKYTVDFIAFRYDIKELLTDDTAKSEKHELDHEALPILSSIIPQKHIIPNNKLANSLTKKILNAGKFDLRVSGKGKDEIKTRCMLSYEGDNVTLSSKQAFTEYDRNVADGIASLYEYGDESHIVTAATVYRAMVCATETETPSQQQIVAVTRSLDKMRFVRVQIDCTEELTKREISLNGEQVTGGKIDTYLLALEKIEIMAGGQKTTAYKIMKAPILYEYSRLTGQVITVSAALLDVRDKNGAKIPNTEKRIAVKSYLMRRISVMKGKKGKNTSRHILYESVYDEICITTPTDKEKRLMREYIPQVLNYWKREQFITGYKDLKMGNKKIGIEIQL